MDINDFFPDIFYYLNKEIQDAAQSISVPHNHMHKRYICRQMLWYRAIIKYIFSLYNSVQDVNGVVIQI